MGLFEFRFLARCSWYGITPVLWFHHTFVLWGPLSYLHFRSINPLLEFITLKIQKIIPKIFANLFSLYEFHGHFISFLKTTFSIGLVVAIALSSWFFIDFLCCWKDFRKSNKKYFSKAVACIIKYARATFLLIVGTINLHKLWHITLPILPNGNIIHMYEQSIKPNENCQNVLSYFIFIMGAYIAWFDI